MVIYFVEKSIILKWIYQLEKNSISFKFKKKGKLYSRMTCVIPSQGGGGLVYFRGQNTTYFKLKKKYRLKWSSKSPTTQHTYD